MHLRHPKISKFSRSMPLDPLATLVATLPAAAYMADKVAPPNLKSCLRPCMVDIVMCIINILHLLSSSEGHMTMDSINGVQRVYVPFTIINFVYKICIRNFRVAIFCLYQICTIYSPYINVVIPEKIRVNNFCYMYFAWKENFQQRNSCELRQFY